MEKEYEFVYGWKVLESIGHGLVRAVLKYWLGIWVEARYSFERKDALCLDCEVS